MLLTLELSGQIFCGNFQYDATLREIERLFDRYGPLERVDMKTGETWRLKCERGQPQWPTSRPSLPRDILHLPCLPVPYNVNPVNPQRHLLLCPPSWQPCSG